MYTSVDQVRMLPADWIMDTSVDDYKSFAVLGSNMLCALLLRKQITFSSIKVKCLITIEK